MFSVNAPVCASTGPIVYYFALHVGFRSGLVLMPLRDSSKNSSKNLVGVGWIRARVRGWGWVNLGALLKECGAVGMYSGQGQGLGLRFGELT